MALNPGIRLTAVFRLQRIRRILRVCCAAIFLVQVSTVVASVKVEAFSDKPRVFPAQLADPRGAKVRVMYYYDFDRKEVAFATTVGGELEILRLNINESDHLVSLSMRGLIATQFLKRHNNDFVWGASIAWKHKAHSLQLYPYHQSSHLRDPQFEERQPIKFSYEAIRLLYDFEISKNAHIYSGPEIIVRSEPETRLYKMTLRIGGDVHFLGSRLPRLYLAADIQTLQEFGWKVSASAHLGYELGNREVRHRQRVLFGAYSGHSRLGQFYTERDTYVFAGMAFVY